MNRPETVYRMGLVAQVLADADKGVSRSPRSVAGLGSATLTAALCLCIDL